MKGPSDFLSRLELDPNVQVPFEIREDVRTKIVQVSIESTGVVLEK